MYEFHGWCCLYDTTGWDDDKAHLAQGIKRVSELINGFQWFNGFCALKSFNGIHFVHLGGFQNRPLGTDADLNALVLLITQTLPGSYGLLYWRDDENSASPGPDQWHVTVIARGEAKERFDPFLSPSIPVTTDPFPTD